MWDMQRKVIWITCISPQSKVQRGSSRLPTLFSLHRPYPHHSVTSPPFPCLSSCSPKAMRAFSPAQRRKRELCLFAGREVIVKGLIRVHRFPFVSYCFSECCFLEYYNTSLLLWISVTSLFCLNCSQSPDEYHLCILGVSLYLYFLLSSLAYLKVSTWSLIL